MIQIKDLSKAFGSHQVLNELNISFAKGKVHGVVGKNGAGKSTLFNCLVGLDNYEGDIVSDLNPLKNHCSFLPTAPFYFSHMTGLEYLKLVCHANEVKLPKREDLLFQLPYDQYAITYSTGMKKKLAFQSIVLEDKDLIVLDEPFNGVDLES
ncbi:MAG: ATP-binding cassette domain-containing protein, partial [Flavobacteriales bacterium]